MTHRSSFAAYGGRPSPFPSSLGPGRNFSDFFEYVPESQDILAQHRRPSHAVYDDDDEDAGPDRINVRYMARSAVYDLPPYAISEEKVDVRDLRNYCARLFNADPRQIRLIYKGKDLKHDTYSLKKYGLKQNSEVAVVISDAAAEYGSHSGSDEDSGSAVSSNHSRDTRRRPRAHSNVRHRSDESRIPQAPGGTFLSPDGYAPTRPSERQRDSLRPEYADRDRDRQRQPSPNPTTRIPEPAPAADPNSALGKLQALSSTFHTRWIPDCTRFIMHPPSDKQVREKEYRKLNECVLTQIVMKADDVELQGDQTARAFRKELINQANEVMKKLDTASK